MYKRSDNTWLTAAGFMVLILGALVVSPPARGAELASAYPVVSTQEQRVRVKLSAPKVATHTFISEDRILVKQGPRDVTIPAGTPVYITSRDGTLRLRTDRYFMRSKQFVLEPQNGGVLKIQSWDRTPGWDTKKQYNDNQFLGKLHLYPDAQGMLIVNDIDVENYMRGVAEVPEQDEEEKRKALAVVSRSYIAYYLNGEERKFADTRYNASDDPALFQKYLGYGFTLRSPQWQAALKETKGLVLTYRGKVLRAAYSSCTDNSGVRKLPRDIGWGGYFDTTKEVYTAIADPWGVDPVRSKNNQCGHGVGLSGLGATNMAKAGRSYVQILGYYYNAVSFAHLL